MFFKRGLLTLFFMADILTTVGADQTNQADCSGALENTK